MKIIFSRKGFDSANGGAASPIFLDNAMRSVPIPLRQGRPLSDCYAAGTPLLWDVVRDLTNGRKGGDTIIHLDPDLCADALPRKPGWLATFGQEAAAQTRLANWSVGVGDIFLFFGWFKRVEQRQGAWRFMRPTPSIHCFFGWLQVGEVISVPADVTELVTARPWLADHPHIHPVFAQEHAPKRNTVYLASPELTLDGRSLGIPGGGTFPKWSEELQLTANDRTRSKWRVPKWLRPDGRRPAFGAHSDLSLWEDIPGDPDHVLLHSIPIGQEFVLDANHYPEATPWVAKLLTGHAPPLNSEIAEDVTPVETVPGVEATPFNAARISTMNEWETIAIVKRDIGSDTTQRLKVPGGWIYRTMVVEERGNRATETAVAMCFVPAIGK